MARPLDAQRPRPPVERRKYVTGLYDHTRGQGLRGIVRKGPLLAKEMKTLLAMLDVLASTPRRRA